MNPSLRDLKFGRLLSMLKNRGAITSKEALGFCVVHALGDFDSEKWEWILNSSRQLVYSKDKRISMPMKSILYEPGFFDNIKFEYEDKVVPYLKSHSYFSLIRTR